MKNLFLSIIMIVFYHNIFAQSDYWTTIKTPTNVSVEVLHRYEYSSNILAMIEDNAANWLNEQGSNAVRVAPASRRYNCHAYAWHVKDGGNKVWLNAHDDYDDDPEILKKYWVGSAATYSQTIVSKATVAFYGSCWENTSNGWTNNCDHSAKVISPGVFESKWGAWPKYRHSPSDCPYNSSNIQYYAVPVTGNNTICSSGTYSTLNISDASYNWSGSRVSISENSSSVTATKTSNGSGWIKTQISSPYSGTTITTSRKTFWVGVPNKPVIIPAQSSMTEASVGGIIPVNVISVEGGDKNMGNWSTRGAISVSEPFLNPGQGMIFDADATGYGFWYVNVSNECGTSFNTSGTVDVSNSGGGGLPDGLSLSLSPNPANDIITINVKDLDDAKSKTTSEIAKKEFTVRLLNKYQTPVYERNIRSKKFTINVSSYPTGIYYLQIIKDNKMYSKKVVIID